MRCKHTLEWCKDHLQLSFTVILALTCVIWDAPVRYTEGGVVRVLQVPSTRLALHACMNKRLKGALQHFSELSHNDLNI